MKERTSSWFQKLLFVISVNSHGGLVKQTLVAPHIARKRKLNEKSFVQGLRANVEQRWGSGQKHVTLEPLAHFALGDLVVLPATCGVALTPKKNPTKYC